jgi:hypothetical protein
MRVTLLKGASPSWFPAARTVGPLGLVALLLVGGCDGPIAGPGASQPALKGPSADVSATAITTYTDRATWEAAVATAGGTVVNMNFTGLTTGRVTQLDTDYGAFRIVIDDVAASSSSNPGIDIFPDAGCSLGTGDCYVFTFNMLDPTSLFDGPKTNQLIFPQPVMAFGGDFIQAGYTAPPATATGPVTLHFGSETVVINDYVDTSGNGFFGFIATTPVTTIEFTFAKSGTIQNDIFQVYNPAYANGTVVPPPEDLIADLRTVIAELGLPKGTATSLDAKLRAALSALDAGQTARACTSLQDLINYANAQSGKKLTASDAASIIAAAISIRTELGC